MKFFFFEINNRAVTSFYLNIIIEALKNCGYEVLSLKDMSSSNLKRISKQPHDTWFLTTGHKDITQLYFKGYRNFIHWFQGLPAEEDFMRTHSKLRLLGFNFLDKMTIKHCSYAFFVSSYQKDYITRKFHVKSPKHFIMPCFNEIINPKVFFTPGKYEKNTFCYVGSTVDVWQNFETIIKIYKQIEFNHRNCLFKIITPNVSETRWIASKHQLKNVIIKSVAQDHVSAEIADCKFGFLLRKDHIVNNVATPTKLSNYLSNGIIPIISDSILSYRDIAQKHQYMYIVNETNATDVLNNCLATNYNPQLVLDSFNEIFDSYFNRDLYVKLITKELNAFLITTD